MAFRISFLIWAIAVVCHTVLLGLIAVLWGQDMDTLAFVVTVGLAVTSIATLPAFFLLGMVIAVCGELNIEAQQALLAMFISAVTLAALAYAGVMKIYGSGWWAVPELLFTAITSAAIGVFAQHKALRKYFVSQTHSHEN